MAIYYVRKRRTASEEENITYANHCLCKAIDAWRQDRPRWWLSHYGELLHALEGEIDIGLKTHFLRLRNASLQQVAKSRSRASSGATLAEHRLLLER